jgi:hypothetical protein
MVGWEGFSGNNTNTMARGFHRPVAEGFAPAMGTPQAGFQRPYL